MGWGRSGSTGGRGERKTNRKERGRKNEERRNGGGIRTREGECDARITRTTGSAGCILTDSRRYVRARVRTPAEPICPLPSTVAYLLE